MSKFAKELAYASGQQRGMFLKDVQVTSFNPQSKAGNATSMSHCFSSKRQLDEFEQKVREMYRAIEWPCD